MQPARPEVTDTDLGRKVIDVLAYGSIQYMLDNQIPLSEAGFQQLVETSRDSGIGGRITYMTYEWTLMRMKRLFAEHAHIPETPTSSERARRKSEKFTEKLLAMIDGSSTADSGISTPPSTSRFLGPEIMHLIEVFRAGECQRQHVWNKIQSIIADGDPMEQLENYKTVQR